MAAPLFRRIKNNIFGFEVIKHQYIDIHHTKNQAENMFNSCSFLPLNTLFHFISHCILKAACITYKWSWTIIILRLYSQEANLFMKLIAIYANIKLLNFHCISNASCIVFPIPFVPIND